VGDRLGPYRLESLIAQGGTGAVFRAIHLRLEREVAIKVLNPDLREQPEVIRRFFMEALAVNRIRHPNIVDITDLVQDRVHPPYMVMELLQGESLASYIRNNAPVVPAQAVAIITPVCDALAAVHRVNIVHRDLKPENIFLTLDRKGRPRPKLLDFGIAKYMAPEDALITRTGELVGTPDYMSPEQVYGKDVDHRTDVYALGVILYELLTGRALFSSSELLDLLGKQLYEDPRPPSQSTTRRSANAIPPELDNVVLRCLAKKPEDRIQSMGRLKALLRGAVGQEMTDAEIVASMVRRSSIRRKLAAVGAGVGLGFAVVAMSLMLVLTGDRNDQSEEPPTSPAAVESVGADQTGRKSASTIEVVSEPSGAMVFRAGDGRFMGKTPLRLEGEELEGHTGTLIFHLEGHSEYRARLKTVGSGSLKVRLQPIEERADSESPPPETRIARQSRAAGKPAAADGGPPGDKKHKTGTAAKAPARSAPAGEPTPESSHRPVPRRRGSWPRGRSALWSAHPDPL
jgi:serine/threonine-protein kinase